VLNRSCPAQRPLPRLPGSPRYPCSDPASGPIMFSIYNKVRERNYIKRSAQRRCSSAIIIIISLSLSCAFSALELGWEETHTSSNNSTRARPHMHIHQCICLYMHIYFQVYIINIIIALIAIVCRKIGQNISFKVHVCCTSTGNESF